MPPSSTRRVLVAVVAVTAICAAGFGAVRWRAARAREERLRAQYLSYGEAGARERAIEPNLAVHGRQAVVVWMRSPRAERDDDENARGGEAEGAADALGVRMSVDDGVSFGAIDLVRSPGGSFAADPALAVLPDGAFVLTWLAFRANLAAHGDAYDMRVYAARAQAGTLHFGEPTLVTTDEAEHEYDRPWSTVTSRGDVLVGYRAAARGRAGISVARSRDGLRWDRRELISEFGFGGGLVTMCAAGRRDDVYVAYFDPVKGIVLRASHDGGETFPDDAARVVSAPGEDVALEAPSCVADDDELVVAYGIGAEPIDTGSSAVLASVALARSRDGGRTFDARAVAAAPERWLVHPRLARAGVGGSRQLGIVAYATPPARGRGRGAPFGSGELVYLRTAFGGPTRSVTLRGDLRVAPRRDDPAWAGDYLGFVEHEGRVDVAFVDPAPGTPHVVFLRATP